MITVCCLLLSFLQYEIGKGGKYVDADGHTLIIFKDKGMLKKHTLIKTADDQTA